MILLSPCRCGLQIISNQSSVMNSRRLIPDMSPPPRARCAPLMISAGVGTAGRTVCRIFSLPQHLASIFLPRKSRPSGRSYYMSWCEAKLAIAGRNSMTYAREPVLQPVPIESLRPTQITVGMHEVEEKRKRLRKQKTQKIGSFIGRHMIPVVLGPKKRHYVTDHHHLSLALHKEGFRDVLVTVVLDLSALDLDAFWTVLDHKSLVYPFDAQGRRRDFADIPKTVMQLKDDPFRSLAGELRRAGGFAKDTTPFSEFLWADFFRRKIKRKAVEADFDAAMERALRLAKSEEAEYLPGWCGPKADA